MEGYPFDTSELQNSFSFTNPHYRIPEKADLDKCGIITKNQ